METLNLFVHGVVFFACFALGFWLAIEQHFEASSQELRDLFKAWEVEDDLRNEQVVMRVNKLRALWWHGQYENALQLCHAYAHTSRDPRFMVLFLRMRDAYAARITKQRVEVTFHTVTGLLTAPVRDSRGRFVKGNKYRFSRRTAHA